MAGLTMLEASIFISTVRDFRSVRSQQNAQHIWPRALYLRRIIVCV
jgi:hypothetical protein